MAGTQTTLRPERNPVLDVVVTFRPEISKANEKNNIIPSNAPVNNRRIPVRRWRLQNGRIIRHATAKRIQRTCQTDSSDTASFIMMNPAAQLRATSKRRISAHARWLVNVLEWGMSRCCRGRLCAKNKLYIHDRCALDRYARMASAAILMSSPVVVLPMLRRRLDFINSGAMPMALRTCDGC